MNRRPLLVVTGWLVAGVAATGASVVVITFLGDSLTGAATRALSPSEVRQALASAPAGADAARAAEAEPSSAESAAASPTASATPEVTAGRSEAFPARGGVVVARCAGGLVTLRSWTPAQGFEVEDVERGPREKVRVRFEGDDVRTEIEIRCSGDTPVATVKND